MKWWLAFFPLLLAAEPLKWEAKSEEEALFMRRIADFWEEGDYKIAKGQMEEFLQTYPESAFADLLHAALGDLSLREKNYQGALSHYAKLKEGELSRKTFLNRMQCLYHLGWYPTLADECETHLKGELDPEQQLHTSYYLAVALYQQCLNAAKDPSALEKLAQRAKPHFEALFQSEFSREIAAPFAHICCILKEYPKAAQIYLDLAQESMEPEELLFQAALIQSEFDKSVALQTFSEIEKQGKGKAKESAFNQLVLLFEGGQYEAILQRKGEWLEKAPEEQLSMVHLFLGRSHMALKNYREATEELKIFLENPPKDEMLKGALLSLIDSAFRASDMQALELALAKFVDVFPKDPDLAKAKFTHILMLKKGGKIEEAKGALEKLVAEFSQFPERGAAIFELAHLDYQEKKWDACREKVRGFLKEFPQHELAPYAWHYLISSINEKALDDPKNKEELAFDLEFLLKNKKMEESERQEWEFLLAKTNVDLRYFDQAILLLQSLLSRGFTQEGNAALLLALCYRDGSGDLTRFCEWGEKALAKSANLVGAGALHTALFNGYLELAKGDSKQFERAANHLFAAFQHQAPIQTENLLWLLEYYDQKLTGLDKGDENLSKTAAILEALQIKAEGKLIEEIEVKLGKIYLLLDRKEEAALLLEKHRGESPDITCALAEIYAAQGKTEEALQLFDQILDQKVSLRTRAGAKAALESARMRKEGEIPPHILIQLKNLILQKHAVHEPLYLEAALEYIEIQKPELQRRLQLLQKIKRDFESAEDILSKDYHAELERLPSKKTIYQSYLRFFEAEILLTQALLHPEMEKELQGKAKDLLLQIINEKAHEDLIARARKRINGFEQT